MIEEGHDKRMYTSICMYVRMHVCMPITHTAGQEFHSTHVYMLLHER